MVKKRVESVEKGEPIEVVSEDHLLFGNVILRHTEKSFGTSRR